MHTIIKYSILIFYSTFLFANLPIEQVRDLIITTLSKNNPSMLTQFHDFYQQFDRSIHLFFDKNDDQSLVLHIKRIENELQTLEKVCNDSAFVSIHPILKEHYVHVKDLLRILKKYVGSINSVAFALKVKRFEFLLPADIKKRGHFTLFRSLHHRLMC